LPAWDRPRLAYVVTLLQCLLSEAGLRLARPGGCKGGRTRCIILCSSRQGTARRRPRSGGDLPTTSPSREGVRLPITSPPPHYPHYKTRVHSSPVYVWQCTNEWSEWHGRQRACQRRTTLRRPAWRDVTWRSQQTARRQLARLVTCWLVTAAADLCQRWQTPPRLRRFSRSASQPWSQRTRDWLTDWA